MAGINEEEVKIRERLTSLETKLGFIQGLLQEIRDELKDQPTKDDYDFLQGEITTVKTEVADLRKKQESQMWKLAAVSGALGTIGGLLIKFLMG